MKKVFTVGVYDLLHIGHILLFRNAKALGDFLIVAVQDSDVIKKYKPQAQIINDTDKRLFMVHSIRYVDEVVVYQDVDTIVQEVDFDIFVTGPDQNHSGFERAKKWCLANGKEVVVLPRTEGISSTMLRSVIDNEYGKEL
jgi:glycerol-3-phosphate cytidylyltransferase